MAGRWIAALRAAAATALIGASLQAPSVAAAESGVAASSVAAPPFAARRPFLVTSPNGAREDDWYWLRDDTRKDPEVLAYLQAENGWFARHKAPYQALEDKLFGEIRGRIQEDDSSVPYAERGDWFATRYEKGQEYPLHTIRRGGPAAPEEALLDVNALAAGHDFYQVTGLALSERKDLLAFAEDTTGRRQYVVRVKNLQSGQWLPDRIAGTSGQVAWAADDRSLFYVRNDPATLRSRTVLRHVLGTDPAQDVVVHDEADESYYTSVHRSGSQRFIVIELRSTESDEQRVLPVDRPADAFQVFAPRQPNFHYHADHIAGRWVVSTDWQAPNYRLMQVADDRIGDRSRWQPLVAHDPQVFIEGFELFDHFLVLDERADGVRRLRVQPWVDGQPAGAARIVKSDEPAYAASLDVNADQHTSVLRYNYTSLTTPATVYELDMATGERTLKKQQPVRGGYDASQYVTERVWAVARDGVRIPVSLVRRRTTPRDGSAPLYLYAYGSYGFSTDPSFRSNVLSLLDRGFVYAIPHIRGGQEMGRDWYEQGKKLNKKNTFYDFIDATEALLREGYGAPGKVFAQGGSAGGLLMGAVANLRPDLYRGIVAAVPFVDVVTTMLDEGIPLTTNEFDEWGNPKQKAYYDYMLSYSPYDNVRPVKYPALFVATGLYDSQVQYYEPAKWVARLRAAKHAAGDDATPLVFKINMEAGHGGKSGRFTRLKEVAEEYAFVLDLLGITE